MTAIRDTQSEKLLHKIHSMLTDSGYDNWLILATGEKRVIGSMIGNSQGLVPLLMSMMAENTSIRTIIVQALSYGAEGGQA